MRYWATMLMAVLGGLACGCSGGDTEPAPASEFTGIVQEVFVPHCSGAGCHGGEAPAGGLSLVRGQAHAEMVGVAAQRRPERLLVAPGDPEASYLVERLIPGGDRPRMPVGRAPLEEAEVERIRQWIRDGARP